MRKLLACLLALMLPLSALAEAVRTDWAVTVSPEGLAAAAGADEGLAAWLPPLAEFLSGITLTAVTDEENGRSALTLACAGEALISCDLARTDAGLMVICDLLPEDALLLSGGLPASQTAPDWEKVSDVFAACLDRWIAALDAEDATGRFAGDAYESGTRRRTYRFDDRDAALLMALLLDAPWPEDFTALMETCALSAGTEIDDLRGAIRETALNNPYRYVLHLVSDDDEALVGVSLTVYQKEDQVAMLSLGQEDGYLDAVLGWGLRGENVYLSVTTAGTPGDTFALVAQLLRDPKRQGIWTASESMANLLMDAAIYQSAEEDVSTWQTWLSGPALGDAELSLAVTSASSTHEASFALDGQTMLTLRRESAPAEALPPMDTQGLRLIDLENLPKEEEIAFARDVDEAARLLVVRLFKLLPPEWLVTMMEVDW